MIQAMNFGLGSSLQLLGYDKFEQQSIDELAILALLLI